IGAFLGNFICSTVGDIKVDGVRDLSAFKWGFMAAGVAMLLATAIFYMLKNRYIVTPEGAPIGNKPTFSNAPLAEGAESEKAHFSTTSIIITILMMIGLTFVFRYLNMDPTVEVQNPIKVWLYPFIYA
ncbi:MAG TPA: MFS transporter, partial [Flavobacteriales bacterium]|nr:MFS transporter [Flavobacteriales bacterium]